MYSLVIGFNYLTLAASRGLVGQVGLEPTTAKSTRFTVWGDTNYTVLTHMRSAAMVERKPDLVLLKGFSP